MSAQFWLMTGEVPSGPFTIEQIHQELSEGRATWQTPACAIGNHEWRPLVQTPGIGPTVSEPMIPVVEMPVPQPVVKANPVVTNTSDRFSDLVAVLMLIGLLLGAIVLLGGLGYLAYEWLRPSTPSEVCEKFVSAKTAAESKKYATPRMHKLIDEVFKDRSPENPNDDFEFTREVDTADAGVKLVGIRGSIWNAEAGQRKQIEGHFRMVRTEGWKVDDIVFTGMEGVTLEAPISLVDEMQQGRFRTSNPTTPPKPGSTVTTPPTPAPVPRKGLMGVFDHIRFNYGWGGVIVVVVVIAVVLGIRDSMKKQRS